MSTTITKDNERYLIRFDLQPADFKSHKVLKNDTDSYAEETGGNRYLYGIASGMDVDGHGDRITKEGIEGFQEQLKSKNILLFVNHEKDYTNSIGTIESAEIKDGDWINKYRLWKEGDPVPSRNIELAKHVYDLAKGLNGFKPKSFGFSIEGYMEDGDIITNADGSRVIKKVELDPGVSLVSRPAYQKSVVTAIQKALERKTKSVKKNILPLNKSIMATILEKDNIDYVHEVTRLEDAFETAFNETMNSIQSPEGKKEALIKEFDTYRDKMIELLARFDFNLSGKQIPEVSMNDKTQLTTKTAKNKGAIMKIKKEDLLTLVNETMGDVQNVKDAIEGGDGNAAMELIQKIESTIESMETQLMNDATSQMASKEEGEDEVEKEEGTDEEKEAKKEEGEEDKTEKSELQKALADIKKNLTKLKREGEGSADDKAEERTKEVTDNPEVKSLVKKYDVLEKSILAMTKSMDKLISQNSNIVRRSDILEKSLLNLAEGLGAVNVSKSQVVKKSLPAQTNTGFDMNQLADMVAEKVTKSNGDVTVNRRLSGNVMKSFLKFGGN